MLRQVIAGCLAAGLLIAMQSAHSQALTVRGGYSGNWYDPERDGQGVQVEVLEDNRAVVAWYTFGPDDEPVWLFGVGDIRGDTISVELDAYAGGSFPSQLDAGSATPEPWGSAEIRFADCSSAQMTWDTARAGYGSGSMTLRRLTAIEGQRCGGPERFERSFGFSLDAGPGPWEAVFADFTEDVRDSIDTEARWETLPAPLTDRNGFLVAANNASDDLAMFLKAPLHGLQPDTEYRVELEMTIATSVPRDCAGIGGSPGSGVGLKLGAAGTEPEAVEVEPGHFRLNIDKGGGPVRGGRDALLVGDMTNDQQNCPPIAEREWQLKTLSTEGRDFSATTDDEGTLWIFGGSDSGFEGTTAYFLTDFTVRLSPVPDGQ